MAIEVWQKRDSNYKAMLLDTNGSKCYQYSFSNYKLKELQKFKDMLDAWSKFPVQKIEIYRKSRQYDNNRWEGELVAQKVGGRWVGL